MEDGPLETPCWIWSGSRFGSGYGQIKYQNIFQGAHRASYKHFKGEIPQGHNVLHHCDIPLCVNPEHLFLGTQRDNIADMIAKRRGAFQGNGFRGEGNGNAKLTEDDVITIKRLVVVGELSKSDIARKFQIGEGAVYNIIAGRSWSHIILEDLE